MSQLSEIMSTLKGHRTLRNGSVIRDLTKLKDKYNCTKVKGNNFILEDRLTKKKSYVTIVSKTNYIVSDSPTHYFR